MEAQRGAPDGAHERLLRLEQRVAELERAAEGERRARRRARLAYLLLLAVLVLAFTWELNALG